MGKFGVIAATPLAALVLLASPVATAPPQWWKACARRFEMRASFFGLIAVLFLVAAGPGHATPVTVGGTTVDIEVCTLTVAQCLDQYEGIEQAPWFWSPRDAGDWAKAYYTQTGNPYSPPPIFVFYDLGDSVEGALLYFPYDYFDHLEIMYFTHHPSSFCDIGWPGGCAVVKPTSVPEPATLSLLGLGLAALGFIRRCRQPAQV